MLNCFSILLIQWMLLSKNVVFFFTKTTDATVLTAATCNQLTVYNYIIGDISCRCHYEESIFLYKFYELHNK